MTTPDDLTAASEALLIDDLALRFAKRRTGGNVYMDGRHNPLPSEVIEAREVVALVARHVRETGCDGLTVENERLRSALSACGDYIVGLGLPMGARPVWETEYHALIDLIDGLLGGKHYPWLAVLAPTVAADEACAREGCGHAATAHDEGDWTCDDCDCEEYLAPTVAASEAER